MSDIIVTVPKDQYEHASEEKFEPDIFSMAWWFLPSTPRHFIDHEDGVGFVMDGHISYVARCAWLDSEDGRPVVTWDVELVEMLTDPIPMTSFRGFRYFDLPKGVE